MSFVLSDATIVTCDDDRRILRDAAIAVIDGAIAAVGPTDTVLQAHPHLERVRLAGRAILPGLINAHTHTVLLSLKGTVEDWTGEIIYRYMTPISYAMTPSERSVIAALGCLEAIRSGTTTLVDPFRHVTTYAGAMADTGMRLWLSESCADIDTRRIRFGDYSVDEAFGEAFLDRADALLEGWHGARGGRVNCQVAAHAPDNCSPAMLARLMDRARRHGVTRTCHLAQSRGEVAAVAATHGGLTPAEYLGREGFLGPDLTAAHWTHCTQSDVALLADRGVRMAHCPASSSRRGMHRAPLGWIRDAGVEIALGTDNMSEDMFHAMAIGSILHRTRWGQEAPTPDDPDPQAVLDMVTRTAAASVGAADRIGRIAPGFRADLTVLDLATAALRPVIRLVSNVVHYGHPGTVDAVIVDGEWLMRDGRVTTIDEAALLAEAQAVTRSVWERMIAEAPDIAPPPGALQWA
ncbi:MAG: amidohydrolase family protein [Alkalilacustris sp.]